MKYFVTGGCGFIGTNLALSFSKKRQKDVLILDNLSKTTAKKNLNILKKNKISFTKIDIAKSRNKIESLVKKFKPKVIFHLAGQVAMSTSIKKPYLDFQGNIQSTINLLEAIRKFSDPSKFNHISTGGGASLKYLQGNELPGVNIYKPLIL